MNKTIPRPPQIGNVTKDNYPNRPLTVKGIQAYQDWTIQDAAHLLRRTTFGPTYEQIKKVHAMGMDKAVEMLLDDTLPLPDPPINYGPTGFKYDQKYDNVPEGETWVNAPAKIYKGNEKYNNFLLEYGRFHSLLGWQYMTMCNPKYLSIREKMTFFWHNHFAVSWDPVQSAKYLYSYITLLRKNHLGNFRQLVKDMTIEPAMLRFLDGGRSTLESPNENYARELLELFTIGKGPQIGEGNYTNYTERDIVEISKIMTGWVDYGYENWIKREEIDESIGVVYSEFDSSKHDKSTKLLSYCFDNTVIENAEEKEYSNLIDIIFKQDEVARFITRKIYRWFVNFDISPEIEKSVILPLSGLLIANDYNIKPLMSTLLKSEHFYDTNIRGAIIKNPVDFIISILRPFKVIKDEEYKKYFGSFQNLEMIGDIAKSLAFKMNMRFFNPPGVAGWTAYYQAPDYYRVWINSATLSPRLSFVRKVLNDKNSRRFKLNADILDLLGDIENSSNVNTLIEELGLLFLPVPLKQWQKDYLKNILIPGLPDFEWTVEYNTYLADADPELKKSIENRMNLLVKEMLLMPEFQLT